MLKEETEKSRKLMNQYKVIILIYVMMKIHVPISKVKVCTSLNGSIVSEVQFEDLEEYTELSGLVGKEVTGYFHKIL